MEKNNERLIEENRNLAVRIVKLYFNAFEKDDLTQESYLALIKAANCFNPSKGVKFETFATTVIKHELTEYCSRIYDRTERIMIDDITVEVSEKINPLKETTEIQNELWKILVNMGCYISKSSLIRFFVGKSEYECTPEEK